MRAQQKIAPSVAEDRWEPVPVRKPAPVRRSLNTPLVWQVAPRALGVLLLLGVALMTGRALLQRSSPYEAAPPADAALQSVEMVERQDAPPAVRSAAPPATANPQPVALASELTDVFEGRTATAFAKAAQPLSTDSSSAAATPPAEAGATMPQTPSLWSEAAVNCPRTWITDPEGQGAGGPADAACHEFAAPPPAQPTPALEPAAESEAPLATLNVPLDAMGPAPTEASIEDPAIEVARLPVARPASPPKLAASGSERPRSARRSASSWPDEPPPNCGSKRARWRYVDRKQGTKAWFCK